MDDEDYDDYDDYDDDNNDEEDDLDICVSMFLSYICRYMLLHDINIRTIYAAS